MKNPTCPLLALLLAAPSLPLHAATLNWTGSPTSGTWAPATTANWNGATVVHDNTADVLFSNTPAIVNYLTYLGDNPRTVRSITFQGTHTTPLEIRTNNNTTVARTLHFSAATGNAQLNIASTINQTLHIGGGTSGQNNGSVNLVSDLDIDHQGTALLTISRPINETVAGRSITKKGSGTLLLSAANTYTGSTTIQAGIVQLGNATGLGTVAGDTFVQPGGTLDLNNFDLLAGETVTLSGAGQGGIGALYQTTGTDANANSILDDLTLAGDTTIGAATGVRYGIGGNGTTATRGLFTLTKTGLGQFDLRGAVTIGNIVINEGSLQTQGPAVYNTAGYTVTVNSGAYFRAFDVTNPFPRNFILNGGRISSGSSVINGIGNLITGNISLNGNSIFESNGGEGSTITYTGNISETTAGSALTLNGARRHTLAGANTYTGTTTVNNGIFQASGSFTSNFNIAATGTLDGEGITTGTITLADQTKLVFDPTTTGPDQHLRAADFIIPSGAKIPVSVRTAGGGTGVIVLRDGNGGLDLTNFELQNPGRATLALGGAGGNSDLIYDAHAANLEWRALVNTDWNTGGTDANFQNLGTAAPDLFYVRDHVDFTTAATGSVFLPAATLAGNVVFKHTSANDIFLITPAIGTLDATSISTATGTTGNVSIELPLVGATSLTLDGTGTVTLAGANTNTGTTTVNAGTLRIGNGGTAGTLTGTVVNNALIQVNRSDAYTLATVVSGTGALAQTGLGTTILSGENTYTGLTTAATGTLQIGSANTGSIAGDLRVESGAFADFSRNNAATYAGAITGPGIVSKRGTGTLTLTGSNTFTGGINFYNGVTIASAAQLGTGPITMGPGLANTNTLSLTSGNVTNDIYFSPIGTGLKIINLAANATEATLSGTIYLDSNTTTGSGASRISPSFGTITITGKMTGSGTAGYSKRAPGHVVITNTTNDYTGPTSIVDGGTLFVDGLIPGNVFFGEGVGTGGTGNVTGTLAGSGTIAGSVKLELNSKLSPGGTSIGGVNANTTATLTIGGGLDASLIPSGTGKIQMQLGALASSNKDRVNVGGQLRIGTDTFGLSQFTIANAGGLEAGAYTLIHAATLEAGNTLDPGDLTGTIAPGFTGALSLTGNDTTGWDLILTVTGSGNPYEAWTTTYPGLTNTDFNHDFDGDGIATGLEWILGGNPTVSDATSIAPTLTASAANGITLSFHRLEDSIAFTTLQVDYGTTLGTWPAAALIGATTTPADANGVTVTVNDVPSPDNITVTIPATNAQNGKLFARLKATMP